MKWSTEIKSSSRNTKREENKENLLNLSSEAKKVLFQIQTFNRENEEIAVYEEWHNLIFEESKRIEEIKVSDESIVFENFDN